MNKILFEKARYMRLNAGLPKVSWAEAVNMTYNINKGSPHVTLEGKASKET